METENSQPVRLTKTPQESADALVEALNEYTSALKSVKRRYRWATVGMAALALVFGLTFKFNYDGNVSRCEAGNELRAQIDAKFQRLGDLLERAGTGDDPEGRELITILVEDLEPRDCGEINWLGH